MDENKNNTLTINRTKKDTIKSSERKSIFYIIF